MVIYSVWRAGAGSPERKAGITPTAQTAAGLPIVRRRHTLPRPLPSPPTPTEQEAEERVAQQHAGQNRPNPRGPTGTAVPHSRPESHAIAAHTQNLDALVLHKGKGLKKRRAAAAGLSRVCPWTLSY